MKTLYAKIDYCEHHPDYRDGPVRRLLVTWIAEMLRESRDEEPDAIARLLEVFASKSILSSEEVFYIATGLEKEDKEMETFEVVEDEGW